jgi:hypothetical protein
MSDNSGEETNDEIDTIFSNAENKQQPKKKRHRKRKNSNKKFQIEKPVWWIDEPLNSDDDDYEDDMVVKVALTKNVERDEIKPILPGGTLRMGNSKVKLTNYKPTERRLYLEFTHLMWLYINEDLEITTFSSYLSAQVFCLFRLGLQMTHGMKNEKLVEEGLEKDFTVLSMSEGKAEKIREAETVKNYMNTLQPHQVVVETNKFGIIQYPKSKDFFEVLKNIKPTTQLNECMNFIIEKNKPI